MMMLKNLVSLFCLFLLSISLNAEESPFEFLQELQTPSVELTEGLPNNIVNGTVSVISGEYVDSCVDFILKGPKPLVFSRTYSSYIRDGSFFRGWNNNICRGVTTYKSKRDNADSWALTLHQPHGSKFSFTHPLSNKTDQLRRVPFDLVVPKGLTKSLSELSAGQDIKNLKITYNNEKNIVVAKAGNGTRSVYRNTKNKHGLSIFRFTNETNLRGQKLKLGLSEVCTKSAKTKTRYCRLALKKEKKFDKNHVMYHTASDGRKITYKFLQQKTKNKMVVGDHEINDTYYHYYLSEVKKSHGPKETYSYGSRAKEDFYLLKEKRLPEDRFLATSYYRVGTNEFRKPTQSNKIDELDDDDHYNGSRHKVDKKVSYESANDKHHYECRNKYYRNDHPEIFGGTAEAYESDLSEPIQSIKIDDLSDYRLDRVFEQQAPVGIDSTPITTHRYLYNNRIKDLGNGRKEILGGTTEVYDALWHKTTYDFNDDQRIDRINRFKGNDKTNYVHYASEVFKWGLKGSKFEGNLLLSILRDPHQKVHHATRYDYDDHGNIKGITFIGKLTSSAAPEVLADNDSLVENGYERETKSYQYSDEGYNLLISEKDSNDNEMIYSYYPETDLISSKLMKYHHMILKREFFHYDDDAVLIKKIIDDGTSEDENDLTGVSERHLTYIQPRKKIPIGLPEIIEEKYLDLKTGNEHLLMKIVCEYTKQGLLTTKTTFDANDQYAFAESWTYDAHGNIETETNALGETLERKYDKNNLKEQERVGSHFKIKNDYDYSNRLIKQEELHDDQIKYTTAYQYNYLGQKHHRLMPMGMKPYSLTMNLVG